MPSIRRWSVVAAGVAVLVSLPWLVAHRPVSPSSVGAADLLGRIQRSGGVGYSGYAESLGGLSIPVTSQITDVADLLGARTQLRVWYRGAVDWRVDTLSVFGETDVYRDDVGTWTWEYERARATRTETNASAVRLPEPVDVLPTELARRLLSEALPTEASHLPSMRVSGIDAAGVRVRPNQPQSSIDRIDVWASPSTGLALRVDVYGKGARSPAMTTSFLDVSITAPSVSSTHFTPPDQARVRTDDGFDPLSATDTFARVRPPEKLAGIERVTRTQAPGAVGVYGRGVTELVAVPLRGRLGGSLESQLVAAGAVVDGPRTSLAVGPLNLMVVSVDGGGDWLLTGTVTADTLRAAADELTTNGVSTR